MESSPLIKAHDHARAASTATQTSDTTVAINEHTRAAGEFANAAKKTNSVEALRTLKLLEQHHQKLSELLQVPFKRPAQNPNENGNDNDNHHSNGNDNNNNNNELHAQEKADHADATAAPSTPSSKLTPSGATPAERNSQPMPKLAKQPRYPSRDLGASIASNLASARGIRSKYRSQPLSPSVSSTEAPGNVEAGSRKTGSRSKMQNMLEYSEKPIQGSSPEKLSRQSSTTSQESAVTASPTAPSNDEGFSKFYNAFGTIINRISAPLAFAGLPLINEEQADEPAPAPASTPESPTQKRIKLKPSPSVAAEPDISKIYSKATLRAIARDGQSGTDSFYVVPTSGHTASYASILSYADKEKRRNQASAHGHRGGKASASAAGAAEDAADEDDFVDARESQIPHSPSLRRRGAAAAAASKLGGAGPTGRNTELAHVVEELYLENKSLKDALDKLSKRLHAFESMSQNSGMRLAESMRLMRPGSPVSTTSTPAAARNAAAAAAAAAGGAGAGAGARAAGDDALIKKNRELEEQLLAVSKQMSDMERDYTKARANLARYRERWEQLKAGAKARRSATTTSETADDGPGPRSPSLG